ncbi:MAG: GNAT family N-acetyltransferase [Paracoccus sp. (in: a-proteobacteria)]|nr:GNAT family N-acetyltransferase [Paracoccus sp. (in: a-proteobacteria)]
MNIRQAQPSDAPAISALLQELVAAGKRTSPADEGFVLRTYIAHPGRLSCALAEDDSGPLGFQSLLRAQAGNPYGTPEGCGIIGTHVAPRAARRRVGSHLFEVTLRAARDADLPRIEAFIGETNEPALAYYEKIGFRTLRLASGAVVKCLDLSDGSV